MQNKKNMKSAPYKKGSSKTSASSKTMKKAAPARSGRTIASKNTKSKPSSKSSSKPSSKPSSKTSSKPNSSSSRKPNSQAQQVLNHLISKGSINTIEAINKYGVYRLGAVIYNLKKNHDIETSTHEVKGKNGSVSKVAKYTLG